MKICIAQTKSIKGNIPKNVLNHLQIINKAIKLNADIIIFPELSITNYEPRSAKNLATQIENTLFDSFQELSNKNLITIGIGAPTIAAEKIHISMIIFQPNMKRIVYSKQILHSDELAYFINGTKQTILKLKEKKIAIGICYETLQY